METSKSTGCFATSRPRTPQPVLPYFHCPFRQSWSGAQNAPSTRPTFSGTRDSTHSVALSFDPVRYAQTVIALGESIHSFLESLRPKVAEINVFNPEDPQSLAVTERLKNDTTEHVINAFSGEISKYLSEKEKATFNQIFIPYGAVNCENRLNIDEGYHFASAPIRSILAMATLTVVCEAMNIDRGKIQKIVQSWIASGKGSSSEMTMFNTPWKPGKKLRDFNRLIAAQLGYRFEGRKIDYFHASKQFIELFTRVAEHVQAGIHRIEGNPSQAPTALPWHGLRPCEVFAAGHYFRHRNTANDSSFIDNEYAVVYEMAEALSHLMVRSLIQHTRSESDDPMLRYAAAGMADAPRHALAVLRSAR